MIATLDEDLDLIRALRLKTDPPRSWIRVAAEIPRELGDREAVLRRIDAPSFRADFARDPAAALVAAGLPAREALVAAVRAHLGDSG